MTLEKIFARLFSSLLHPLVIPTLGVFILFSLNTYVNFSIPKSGQRIILLIVLFNTAIAPLLSVVVLKKLKVIGDIFLQDKGERIAPLFIAGVFYFFTFYVLRQVQLPFIIYYFMISATILVFAGLLITLHWKISLHMIAMGGFTGFLISTSIMLKTDITLIIMSAIILSGIMGYSRLVLNAHKPSEVYVGYSLGLLFMLVLTAVFV